MTREIVGRQPPPVSAEPVQNPNGRPPSISARRRSAWGVVFAALAVAITFATPLSATRDADGRGGHARQHPAPSERDTSEFGGVVQDATGLPILYKNVTHARTQGVELEGELRFGIAARVSGSYAYLDAIGVDTGLSLTGRNRQQGTVRLDWTPARLGLRANLRGGFYSAWIVSRARTAGGTVETRAPAFALWDLSIAKSLARGAELFGVIDNLTNSQDPNTGRLSPAGAALPIYRPEIGRTLRGGVRWSWTK